MSLVNNMLRDLDQRRKGNSTSPATLSLTPVADAREGRNFKLLVVLALVVSVLAVSSAVYYFQIVGQGAVTEIINRRPELLSQVPVISSPVIEQDELEIVPGSEAIPPVTNAGTPTELSGADAISIETNPVTVAINATPESVPVPVVESPRVEQTQILTEENLVLVTLPSGIPVDTPANTPTNTPDTTLGDTPPSTTPESSGGSAIIRSNTQPSAQERDTQNVQNALALFNSNQIGSAFMMLSNYLQANGDAHQSRETYAKLLISQGVLTEANQVIDDGLTVAPNRPGYKKLKARLLMADSQYMQAAALLINRAPSLTEDLEYHDMLATAQLAGQEYGNAVNTYTNLIRLNNSEGKWWYGIAAAYDGLNDGNSAVQAYTQALQSSNLSSALRQRSQRRITELRQ